MHAESPLMSVAVGREPKPEGAEAKERSAPLARSIGRLVREEELDATSELCRNLLPQLSGLVPLKDKMQIRYLEKIESQTNEIEEIKRLNEEMFRDLQLLKNSFGVPIIYSFRNARDELIKIGRCMDNETFLKRRKKHEKDGFSFVNVTGGSEKWESHVKKELKKYGFKAVAGTDEYFRITEELIRLLVTLNWPLLPPSEPDSCKDAVKWWCQPYQPTLL